MGDHREPYRGVLELAWGERKHCIDKGTKQLVVLKPTRLCHALGFKTHQDHCKHFSASNVESQELNG